MCQPSGFALEAITVPVTAVTGDADEMVPVAHARWLAARLPYARLQIYPHEGHMATAIRHLPEILTELVSGL
jgi:pimeloyl-ACP methyl ester carboxylesterase